MDSRSELDRLLKTAGLYRDGDAICRKSGTKTIKMSNFLVVPTADVEKSDGSSINRFAEVVVYVCRGGEVIKTDKITISMTELNNMEWVWSRWGLLCHIYPPLNSNKEYLRAAMFELAASLPKKHIYTNTGWCKAGGSYVYAYNGGAVGNTDITVELESGLSNYELSEQDFDDTIIMEALKALQSAAPLKIILPLISLAFLSPLNEFFRQVNCEPAFVMYLLGKTQSRKSTLAALILSFFGKFTSSGLPMNFKDTSNALEKKCFILKDVLTVIDDFHPVFSAADKTAMMQKMQSIARGYGDRCGRSRLRSDMTIIKGNAPRGNVIVTGEDFPDIGESGSARTFLLEIDRNDIPVTEDLNAAQRYSAMGVYSAIMRKYIEWLIRYISELPSQLKKLFEYYRARALTEKVGVNGRAGDIIAWLQVGYVHFQSFIDSLLGSSDIIPDIEKSWRIFSELSACQKNKAEELSPVKMFLNAVSENLQSGEIYVTDRNDRPLSKFNANARCVGYYENDIYYFYPNEIFTAVMQYYKNIGMVYPLSKNQIFKQLAAEQIIDVEITDGKTNYSKQKRFGNVKKRFLTVYGENIDA